MELNSDDFLWRDPNLASLRSSMDYCSMCTRYQMLTFWWDIQTFMETCCLSIMMTIIIKQFPRPILYSGFSFRGKVSAAEVCESPVYPVLLCCSKQCDVYRKKNPQSYFIMLNSIIIMDHEMYSQLISLAVVSSGNLFRLRAFLLIFSSVR